MGELLLALIKQLNTSVFVLIIILILGLWAVYKVGTWKEKFSNHEDEIKALKDLSKEVVTIRTKADLIYQSVKPHIPVINMSPLVLTDSGKKIKEKIKANEIFKKYEKNLKEEADKFAPKTAYDIQMIAMKIVKEKLLEMLNEDELIPMKEEAYKNGLLLENILAIFGILLRNAILTEKNIPVSSIDSIS